ncbi:MAG TPA: hypothetical protein VFE34_00985 [Dongiaceae bacterium]|jgi:hypothetical protein|nr:hypothetical protein [Dongiaceae bacterium]
MRIEQSPLRTNERLTLEQFDFYVARARAERSKAIAEFGGHVVAWLAGIAVHLTKADRSSRWKSVPTGGKPAS